MLAPHEQSPAPAGASGDGAASSSMPAPPSAPLLSQSPFAFLLSEAFPFAELSIFSLRRPRNLLAGTSSALKSMVKGVAFGTYRLFADPIAGANQSGFPGFCQGLASGLAAAVSLPVAGAAVGCVQARVLSRTRRVSKQAFRSLHRVSKRIL
eukprot:4715161-Pleurochrysis_carterae.AAC.3